MTKRILIITGEASGDLHGAHLAQALRESDPSLSIQGVGGARMRAAGVQMLEGIPQLDVIGLIGPGAVRVLVGRILAIRRFLRREPLDLVVLIDQPGLNFHFARVAKRAGCRVVYYITPQLWAWRPGRMKWMQRRVDHAVVILPFEEKLYRQAGVPCTFVGHPLLDEMAPSYDRDGIRAAYSLQPQERVLGLLPGSRMGEVRALLPLMLEAARTLNADCGPIRMVLAVAETVDRDEIKLMCDRAGIDVRQITGNPNEVMAASDLLFVASGTATLQAAIIGTPMVIVYKMAWLGYLIARLLTSTPASLAARQVCWPNIPMFSIGLPNLIAGRSFIPELIQTHASPERLAAEARRILKDDRYRNDMRAEMVRVRALLGEPGASKRAAKTIIKLLGPEEVPI
ncbi:MAG TPA: lipid-A-disaccharide synthase [Nitrospirales bacterium]|jgi:lipid-A-disaccharide synthase